jgi:hypothetical protein
LTVNSFLAYILSVNVILFSTTFVRSWGSSVSIESDYGLDDQVSIPDRDKGFFIWPHVQTGPEAHPASYPIGTGVLSLG